jgi:hypothetical protein
MEKINLIHLVYGMLFVAVFFETPSVLHVRFLSRNFLVLYPRRCGLKMVNLYSRRIE